MKNILILLSTIASTVLLVYYITVSMNTLEIAHKIEQKYSTICYVDQQVEEEYLPPNLPQFKITTKVYIENDTCYFLIATWEDIASEETLQKKKEDRLNQANDLRFETNMGIITGKINICK